MRTKREAISLIAEGRSRFASFLPSESTANPLNLQQAGSISGKIRIGIASSNMQ